MPFTFSHPAIVLPLKKFSPAAFSLTSLITGSIVPDFEYFVRMKVKSVYSHSLFGLFWFDIPVALLLAFIYHNTVRELLIVNLPGFLSKRLNAFRGFNWNAFFTKNWLIVIVSVLIGAASHLFWDSFTHPQGYFTHHIALLRNTVKVFSTRVAFYQILQQLSSLIGGVIVIWAILSLKIKSLPQPVNQTSYWIIVVGITLATLGCRFYGGMKPHLIGDIIVTTIAGFLSGIIIAPIIFKLSSNKDF